MKKAYVTTRRAGSKELVTTLIDPNHFANYDYYELAYKNNLPIEENHVCTSCGKAVKLVCKESADGKAPQFEFAHAAPKSEQLCPTSFAASLHWDPVFSNNHFDARAIGPNRAMWEEWKSRNRGELNGIIHTLEGRHPPENKKALIAELFRKNETMIMPLIGADPKFILAAIAVGLGRLHVTWPSGRDIPVAFKWAGERRTFIVKDMDGKEHKQFAPGNKVVLCIDGNPNQPFFPKGSDTPIYIRVFPETTPDPRASITKGQSTFPDCTLR